MRARSLTATVLGLLACVALPLALASAWTSRTVEDTDRFVAAVGPLAQDAAVQAAAEQRLEDAITAAIGLDLEGPLGSAFATALHTVVVKVVESDAFPPAWEAAVSSAHDEAIAVLEGKEPADGRISLRLGTLVNTVLGLLDERGLLPPSAPTSVEVSLPVMDVADLERARSAYQTLDAAGLWLPLLWAALFAATVALAVRRGRALAWLAAGSALGLVLLLGAVRLGELTAVDSLPAIDQDLAEAVLDVVLHNLRTSIFVSLGVCVVVLVAGWLVARASARAESLGGAA